MSAAQQILHLIANLDGYGLSRQLELLAEQQLAAGRNLRVVALAATRETVAGLRSRGVECCVLDRRWRRDPFVAVRLTGELRRRSHDVVHVWGQSALDGVRAIRRFARQTPCLASLPNGTLLNFRTKGRAALGIAAPAAASLSRREFLAKQLLSEDAFLIAVGGPLTRTQRVDEAIWYFELVRTLEPRVRLLIFGDGPDRHRLERFSRLAAEPSAIRFLGYRSDYRELLSHVDLFWHTSIADEALPLTVLEAMAAGVPVVANDGPECRQIIDDGNNGYLVADQHRAAFARQTRRIMQDAAHAEELGANAAESIVARYSVEKMASAYANLYGKLLGC